MWWDAVAVAGTSAEAPVAPSARRLDLLVLVGVAVVVLASRLPFLDAGYGSDPDAWALARAARAMARTGTYTASRMPGFPVHEIACALLGPTRPVVLNAATAACSAFAVAAFVLILRAVGSPAPVLGGLALAFVPAVYVHSTNAMDYLWSLAFVLGALYLVLRRRALAAGVLLGLAIGCRITAGAMLLPLALLLPRWRAAARLAGAALLVGGLAFVPVVWRYGLRYFSFHEDAGYPALAVVATRGTLEVWGQLGLISLLGGIAACVLGRRRAARRERASGLPGARVPLACWLAIVLYVIAYLRLPHESAYLIPVVPFAILLLGRALPRPAFAAVCVGLAASSFVQPVPLRVPAVDHHRGRLRQMAEVREVIRHTMRLPPSSVVVTGWWHYQMRGLLAAGAVGGEAALPSPASVPAVGPFSIGGVEYVRLLDARAAGERVARGARIDYLPLQRRYTLAKHGVDLRQFGARPVYDGPG